MRRQLVIAGLAVSVGVLAIRLVLRIETEPAAARSAQPVHCANAGVAPSVEELQRRVRESLVATGFAPLKTCIPAALSTVVEPRLDRVQLGEPQWGWSRVELEERIYHRDADDERWSTITLTEASAYWHDIQYAQELELTRDERNVLLVELHFPSAPGPARRSAATSDLSVPGDPKPGADDRTCVGGQRGRGRSIRFDAPRRACLKSTRAPRVRLQ